jgi:DNA-binding response OmpR family regulator
MHILIAEDDFTSRRLLEATLLKWGYKVTATSDGVEALRVLQSDEAPKLAILDWMMPHMDGVEVCRQARTRVLDQPTYIILLTAKGGKEDIVAGLEAGADDYLTKPFDRQELHARLRVGSRMVELQTNLTDRVRQLEDALSHVKQLQVLVPMCAYCKKVRDDQNYWQQVESYIGAHTEARFSHGICPGCMETVVKPELEKLTGAPMAAAV